jgi:hypothetical protein
MPRGTIRTFTAARFPASHKSAHGAFRCLQQIQASQVPVLREPVVHPAGISISDFSRPIKLVKLISIRVIGVKIKISRLRRSRERKSIAWSLISDQYDLERH